MRGGISEGSSWRRPAEPMKSWGKQASSWQVSSQKPATSDGVLLLDELLDRSSRVVFIRRVYGLLSASLGLSALSCTFCAAHPQLVVRLLAHPLGQLFLWTSMAISFLVPLALSLSPELRHDPLKSLPTFAAFAIAESALLGVISTTFRLDKVVLAILQTAAAVCGLTIWAHQPNPNYDLTRFGSGLFASLLVLLLTGVFGAVLNVPGTNLVYSTLGAIVFSLFIVYDTELIVGGKHRHVQLDTRDYVLGATTLFVDIANLFLFLLRLVDADHRNGNSDA